MCSFLKDTLMIHQIDENMYILPLRGISVQKFHEAA